MSIKSYLVGNIIEKERIHKLLYRRLPGTLSYDFSNLCNCIMETLNINETTDVFDVESALAEFMDDYETDIRETNSLFHLDLAPHVSDVKEAMLYFIGYLQQLGIQYHHAGVSVTEGSPLSTLIITIDESIHYS